MENEKKLLVSAIRNGTVIDHIPAKDLFKVISILGLDTIDVPMTFGTNLESQKLGKKGVIKISDKYFEDNDLNKIALITTEARLNVIKDFKVSEKREIKVPDKYVVGIAKCVNPKCVTNHENIQTKFTVFDAENLSLKCEYCEKITDKKHLKIIK
jgi:aspartate carbamoyltransferase regulatory subunit